VKLNKRSSWLLFFWLCFSTVFAQNNSNFSYPLDSVQQYISLFNALRDNHFHAGFDLKTQEKEGLPVLAAADGFISRIKIQSVGYGKAIYIEHLNGYSTVYGHLKNYHQPISDWITTYQNANKLFEFDHIFTPQIFKVKKGDTIGFSGNSGRSTGPHVHFEIRNTKTEHPLNPLLHGFNLIDTLEPRLEYLHIYVPSKNQPELISSIQILPDKINRKTIPFSYTDTIYVSAKKVLFGFEGADYLTDSNRKYMLFGFDLKHNQDTIYGYQMTEAAFDKNRLINQFIDYKNYVLQGKRIQWCGTKIGVEQPFKQYANSNKGWIEFKNNPLLFTFSLKQHTNKTVQFHQDDSIRINPSIFQINFTFVYKPDTIIFVNQPDTCNKLILPVGEKIECGAFQIKTSNVTFFDTAYICVDVSPKVKGALTETIQLLPKTLPLKGNYELSIKLPDSLIQYAPKLCWVNEAGNYQKTIYEGGYLKCNPSVLGNFRCVADWVKPTITALSFKGKKQKGENLVFKIDDKLSGIKSYNAYVDGVWRVFEYDAKNDLLVLFNASQFSAGMHLIKLVVEDNCGNKTIFQKKFIR